MEVVEVKILFFAKSRELVGVREKKVTLQTRLTTSQLRQNIINLFPCLKVIENNFLIAVNEEYLAPDNDVTVVLNTGDELAIIPPISGG